MNQGKLEAIDKTTEEILALIAKYKEYNKQPVQDGLIEIRLEQEKARLLKKAKNTVDNRWLSVIKGLE